MTIRSSAFLSFMLCLFVIAGTGDAWATCASIGVSSDVQQISDKATEKFRDLEKSVNKQLQTASDNLIEAIKAMTTARTDAAAQTLKSEVNNMDADNHVERETLVSEKMIEVTQDLKPLLEECKSLTAKSRTGAEMEEITRAAESAMNSDWRKDYTNDVASPYSKGVTSALAIQFVEYIKYYCNPLANNGNMPSAENPLSYTYPDDVKNKDGSVGISAGTTINVYCGQERAQLGDKEKFLIDADIRVDDTIFSDKTWPQDKESPYGRMLYAAASQGVRLLTPSPRDPFNPSAFKGQAGIEAFMERRAFEARMAMAKSQFAYITSKRVPASSEGGQWMRDMLAKELAGDKEAVLNASGQTLSDKMTSYCGESTEGSCGMWQLVKQIPDTASKNEFMNFIMRDRFLGMDYLLENSNNNEAQSQRQQIDLLTLDIVQQREINETLERILGTVAAKYSLRVDQMAKSSTVGQSR